MSMVCHSIGHKAFSWNKKELLFSPCRIVRTNAENSSISYEITGIVIVKAALYACNGGDCNSLFIVDLILLLVLVITSHFML